MKKQKTSFFNLHLTSNISIALVLFMVGLLTWLLLTVTNYAHRSQENISLSIQLDDSISQTNLARLESYIKVTPFSTHYVYISKDSALTELTETLGDDPTSLLGYNPINASIELYLTQRYANIDSIKKVVIPKLSSFAGINDIIYEQDMIELMDNNIRRLLFFISIIVLVLLFISIVLINNTIRLTIYSKRFIINTMRLVGARNSFIRAPFIRKAMVNALIGAFIGIVLLAGSLYLMQIQINGYSNISELFNPKITIPVAAIMIFVSLVINYFATLFAVNRYLRMSTDKLYFV
ncbi:MAG: permease-like cell division protein FtsX [bacterium]|nr:permease-like cell division protein FtsX [Candidatus Minthenecus merdequi]